MKMTRRGEGRKLGEFDRVRGAHPIWLSFVFAESFRFNKNKRISIMIKILIRATSLLYLFWFSFLIYLQIEGWNRLNNLTIIRNLTFDFYLVVVAFGLFFFKNWARTTLIVGNSLLAAYFLYPIIIKMKFNIITNYPVPFFLNIMLPLSLLIFFLMPNVAQYFIKSSQVDAPVNKLI